MTQCFHRVDISEPRDWYRVDLPQVCRAGGASLLAKYNGSLVKTLQAVFPEHSWLSYRFSSPHHVPQGVSSLSKSQYVLLQHVKRVSL